MAGFTSLGLIGAGLLASKLLGGKKKDQPLAPAPTDANAIGAVAPPAPPIVNPADQNMAARGAAQKQRKRSAQGSLLTNPIAPKSNAPGVTPKLVQRSLLSS